MILYTGPAARINAMSLNLFKNFIALLFLLILATIVAPPWPEDSSTYVAQLAALGLSGLIGITLGDSAFFAGLRSLGPQLTSAIQCLAPPLSALLALAYFGETLTAMQVSGLLVTTLAILGLLMTQKGYQKRHEHAQKLTPRDLRRGLFWAIVAALCQALGIVIARQALQEVDSTVGTLSRLIPAVVGLLVLTVITSRTQDLVTIAKDRRLTLKLVTAAFLGSFLGLVLMSLGAKYAKAGITTALSSTYPLWVIPLARLFLKERTDLKSIGWTLLAVVGIIVMMDPFSDRF